MIGQSATNHALYLIYHDNEFLTKLVRDY